MMRLVLRVILMAVLSLPSAFAYGERCRDYRQAYPQKNLSSVTAVDADWFASVTFDEASPLDRFAIKGTFCDSQLEPLAGKDLRIVRVARQENAGGGALSTDAFSSGVADPVEVREVTTARNGNFMVTGLVAGEYVIEVVDWESLDQEYVVFDLRHIPGPPLHSAVGQVGLINP